MQRCSYFKTKTHVLNEIIALNSASKLKKDDLLLQAVQQLKVVHFMLRSVRIVFNGK